MQPVQRNAVLPRMPDLASALACNPDLKVLLNAGSL